MRIGNVIAPRRKRRATISTEADLGRSDLNLVEIECKVEETSPESSEEASLHITLHISAVSPFSAQAVWS